MKACTITNIKLPKSCEPNHFIVIGPDGNGIGLDKTLLKELLPHLKAWIETGSFEIQEEKDPFDDLAKFRQRLVALRGEEIKHFSTDFTEYVLTRMIEALDLVSARNNREEAIATLDGYREIHPELFEPETGE
jgi:hypothetical protein